MGKPRMDDEGLQSSNLPITRAMCFEIRIKVLQSRDFPFQQLSADPRFSATAQSYACQMSGCGFAHFFFFFLRLIKLSSRLTLGRVNGLTPQREYNDNCYSAAKYGPKSLDERYVLYDTRNRALGNSRNSRQRRFEKSSKCITCGRIFFRRQCSLCINRETCQEFQNFSWLFDSRLKKQVGLQ